MKARKRFAQHFLEPAWVEKLVAALEIDPRDAIVEIGPGRGALTRPLCAAANRVLAIEIDRDLASALNKERPANLSVLAADVLKVDLASVIRDWLGSDAPRPTVRVVGNLPYNVSSPILFRLLAVAPAIGLGDAMLMLQREVADRLVADVGTGDYGVLTILTAIRADVTRLLSLPPGAFRPAPKVHSAVVRLDFRPSRVPPEDEPVLVAMVRSMFTQRRKVLLNALKPFAETRRGDAMAALTEASIAPQRRAETLTLDELTALARAFRTPGS